MYWRSTSVMRNIYCFICAFIRLFYDQRRSRRSSTGEGQASGLDRKVAGKSCDCESTGKWGRSSFEVNKKVGEVSEENQKACVCVCVCVLCVCVEGGGCQNWQAKEKRSFGFKAFPSTSWSIEYFLLPCYKFSLVWSFAHNVGEGIKNIVIVNTCASLPRLLRPWWYCSRRESEYYVPQTSFGRHIVFAPFLIIIIILPLSFFLPSKVCPTHFSATTERKSMKLHRNVKQYE